MNRNVLLTHKHGCRIHRWIERACRVCLVCFERVYTKKVWKLKLSIVVIVWSAIRSAEDTKRIYNKLFGRLCCNKTRVQWGSSVENLWKSFSFHSIDVRAVSALFFSLSQMRLSIVNWNHHHLHNNNETRLFYNFLIWNMWVIWFWMIVNTMPRGCWLI